MPYGDWVYMEHADMIRDLCARKGKDVLEWTAEDGWGTLCQVSRSSRLGV